MFTRQHYKAIAEIIREAKEDWRGGTPTELVLGTIEERLDSLFAADNPRFDSCRFRDACEMAS